MSTTNGTGATWGQTFTLDDLKRLERELAAMPKPAWTLIAPDGRAWQGVEPRELLAVLAGACFPLFPSGVPVAPAPPCGKTPCPPGQCCKSPLCRALGVPELADCATRCKCPGLERCARRAAGLVAYGVPVPHAETFPPSHADASAPARGGRQG